MMPSDLYRLAYFSRSVIPADADFALEIRRILDVSRRNNARIGVTGALLFNRGAFGQVLEGPYAAVDGLFETIQNDERHGDVVALQFEPAPERGFGPWTMAHVGSVGATDADYGAVALAEDFDPATCSGRELFATLRHLLVDCGPARSAA